MGQLINTSSSVAPGYSLSNATEVIVMGVSGLLTASNGSDVSPASDGNSTAEGISYILPWWQQAFFYAIFVIIFVMAAGGNIIVIWIVLAHKRMRTVTNYFLVNLAVADVLISIFNVPFHLTFNMYQIWFFGLEYCKINFFIAPFTISVSVLTFMAIAIDRYIAIIHPLRPRLTGRIVLSIISVIWILSFLLALPNLLFATIWRLKDGREICWVQWPDSSDSEPSKQDLAYNIILMILNYFLPIITLFATYARIGWELWGSKVIGEAVPMQADRVKSKRKVVKMMIAVVVIFGLCWLPTHIYFILTYIFTDILYWRYIQQVYLLIYWLAMSNSMYNPIIYCLMNARFRQGFLRFFRWCPCSVCRRQHHLLTSERGAMYSARMSMGSNQGGLLDKNGSLLHTTVESMDDHTVSTYRMVPLRSASTNSARAGGNNTYNHLTHRNL